MKNNTENESFRKRLNSFKYAFRGILFLIREQPNARIHLLAATLVIFAGFYFDISQNEWLAVIISIGIVFGAEAFNSAVEETINFISPEYHSKAGKIKDLAAGAVLIVSVSALIVGIIVFLPYIINI